MAVCRYHVRKQKGDAQNAYSAGTDSDGQCLLRVKLVLEPCAAVTGRFRRRRATGSWRRDGVDVQLIREPEAFHNRIAIARVEIAPGAVDREARVRRVRDVEKGGAPECGIARCHPREGLVLPDLVQPLSAGADHEVPDAPPCGRVNDVVVSDHLRPLVRVHVPDEHGVDAVRQKHGFVRNAHALAVIDMPRVGVVPARGSRRGGRRRVCACCGHRATGATSRAAAVR